jgi:hypothetical protein
LIRKCALRLLSQRAIHILVIEQLQARVGAHQIAVRHIGGGDQCAIAAFKIPTQ